MFDLNLLEKAQRVLARRKLGKRGYGKFMSDKAVGASSKTVRKQKIHTIRSILRQRRLMLLTAFVEHNLFIYFDGLQDVSDVAVPASKQEPVVARPLV